MTARPAARTVARHRRSPDALDLTPAARSSFDEPSPPPRSTCPWPKAYGGDMVAQAHGRRHPRRSTPTAGCTRCTAISCARRHRCARSATRSSVLRDGRGFSTRQVRGYQNGKPRLPRDGLVPGPRGRRWIRDAPSACRRRSRCRLRGLPPRWSAGHRAGRDDEPRLARYWSWRPSFDMRHVAGPGLPAGRRASALPHQSVWVKSVRCPAPATRPASCTRRPWPMSATTRSWSRCCGARYVLGRRGSGDRSLDHAMWFHRPAAGRLVALRPGGRHRPRRPRSRPAAASSPATAARRHRRPGGHAPRGPVTPPARRARAWRDRCERHDDGAQPLRPRGHVRARLAAAARPVADPGVHPARAQYPDRLNAATG